MDLAPRLFDHRLEARVLGALLEVPQLFDRAIAAGFTAEAFVLPKHQAAFRARIAVKPDAHGGCLWPVVEELTRNGDLRLAGGQEAVSELIGQGMRTADAAVGLDVLLALWRARKLLDALPAEERTVEVFELSQPDQGSTVQSPSMAKPRTRSSKLQGLPMEWADTEKWPEEVSGAAVLDEIADVLSGAVVFSRQEAEATALWVLMTYCLDHLSVAPRLIVSSPTRECGKTRLLTVLAALVRRQLPSASVTPAVLFRAITAHRPTLLLDEVDNARLLENPELRAVLNSGHTRSLACVLRTDGDHHEPRYFSTWCAIALAGIGDLPDTLTSRGIRIALQRKRVSDRVRRLRESQIMSELEPVRRRIVRWVADNAHSLESAVPELPPRLDGRAADNWSALLTIADVAGGRWPERARAVALAFTGAASETAGVSEQLLADMQLLFEQRDVDKLASTVIIEALLRLEERPWSDLDQGRPLTVRRLARLLRPFGVQPRNIRLSSGVVVKGYVRSEFEDAWARYVPPGPLQALRAAIQAGEPALETPLPVGTAAAAEAAPKPLEMPQVADVAATAGEPGLQAEWFN